MSFSKHNPIINKYAQSGEAEFIDTLVMVQLSIQQHWYSIGDQMADWRRDDLGSKFLWGGKEDCIRHAIEWQTYKYAMMLQDDPVELMLLFTTLPNLGLVKAGFLCQLFAGSVGCLDLHNLRNYDVPKGLTTFSKSASYATRRRKVEAYVEWCDKRRSQFLWNRWCGMVAAKYPKRFADAQHVSATHVEYLIGDNDAP